MQKSEAVKKDGELNDSKPSSKTKVNDTPKCGLTPWRMPQPYCSPLETLSRMHPLVVYNSLTRSKVRFIPQASFYNPNDRKVMWYQCGPTVYSDTHLGHARTYVSLDIIRRIMQDVAGYDVLLCQNVTDIDDKIILRSSAEKVPFLEFARKYEAEFNHAIYGLLGCRPPDITTRVTDYVTEIISFIEVLIRNGVAYESQGSVYFSVSSFESQGHRYGKLLPEQIGNSVLLAEGEGALSAEGAEKRAAADFALWKRTKGSVQLCDGTSAAIEEPFWQSPWGKGRPGWHIECSAMAHAALGAFRNKDSSSGPGPGELDVHAGGVDLKFPHHDNEIAQSEGFLGRAPQQWVNYWLHTGHLNIRGQKMSKSKKNFVTVEEALRSCSSRQLRLLFLLHKYNATMDFTAAEAGGASSSLEQAEAAERLLVEFFHNAKAALRQLGGDQRPPAEDELQLRGRLLHTQAAVRAALLNDFDTPAALALLQELVRDCNRYMDRDRDRDLKDQRPLCAASLTAVAGYVTAVLRTFGLTEGGSEMGFGSAPGAEGEGGREKTLSPLLDVLSRFREAVRQAAISGNCGAVLSLADELRDDVLPDLGVRMEDKGSGAEAVTVWKLEDAGVLQRERQQKEAARAAKELQRQEAARKLAEKDDRAKIPPSEMFLGQSDLYASWDADGFPTSDKSGQPLSKAAIKKLQKEVAKQKEAYEKYQSRLSTAP